MIRSPGFRLLGPLLSVWLLLALLVPSFAEEPSSFPEVKNSPAEDHLLPMPADEAVAKMTLPPGFRATLFAAEPEVQNPIAMAWDNRGRLWVAENYTYSDRQQRFDLSMRDRVLIFYDHDNDGRADERKVFLDNVQILTSVETGHGGVWLMCPPQLLFVPDADGDDIPDGPPQVILDGFEVAKGSYHNFANGLRWGPEGWLYGRCGHSCPAQIGAPGTPDEDRVPMDGGIWRYHPDRKIVEVLCHGTVNPWGHDWDENGELFFINTVIGHLWHCIPGSHFKESFGESNNRHVYERMDMIADHYHFDTRGSWSASRDGRANDLGGGHAHIGMMIYQGHQWPAEYRGKLFTLNMHGRRANVERLERLGSGYVGRHEPDFFVAADPFFRGIDLSTGPDGQVYVIDWSDTGECHEHTGVHRLSGRIFKISHGEAAKPSKAAKPGAMGKPACLQGDGPLPQLWRNYQAGETIPEALRALETHDNEHMRVWAIRLLTDFWPLDHMTGPHAKARYPEDPLTHAMLLRMAKSDPSGLVLRVLASTLQRMPVDQRVALARELVQREELRQDHNMALMVWYGLIPVGEKNASDLVTIAEVTRCPGVVRPIARYVASRTKQQPEALNALLKIAPTMAPAARKDVLLGMQEAFRGWRTVPKPAAWEAFASRHIPEDGQAIARELSTVFGDGRAIAEIRRLALDSRTEIATRQAALQTLIEAQPEDLRKICESLLDVRVLNATAAQGLAQWNDPKIAELIASKYGRFQPEDRPRVLEQLVSRPAFARVLLEEVAKPRGAIPAKDITAAHARQILSLGDESLRHRLSEVWGELRESSQERLAIIQQLTGKLTPETLAQADLSRGRLLFQKSCRQCHVLFGDGEKVGPDLTGAQRANLDYLLGNMIDPSAVVSKDFRMSIVLLADGRVLNGLIVSRNDETLVLRTATEQVTLPVEEIDEIQESNLSAMPDGLLQNLTDHQIRDLVAYLMQPGQVPLPAEPEN